MLPVLGRPPLRAHKRTLLRSLLRDAALCGKTIGVQTLVDGVVAQLVERLVRNEKVAGSIPVGSTILQATKPLYLRYW